MKRPLHQPSFWLWGGLITLGCGSILWLVLGTLSAALLVILGGVTLVIGDQLFHERSTFAVPLAIFLILFGTAAGTLGWDVWANHRQRADTLLTLADDCAANRNVLLGPAGLGLAEDELNVRNAESARPADTTTLAGAVSGGLFLGARDIDLLASIRSALAALVEYNYSLSNRYASAFRALGPRDLSGYATRGLEQLDGLGTLLAERYEQDECIAAR
jgi:hypothetical protein